MNYLAHAYLSFSDPGVLVGNMVSDFVKGQQKNSFSGKPLAGIYLHRAIDSFTDTHPSTREAMQYFRADYRLYSGAIMDVIYDHFLATDEKEFSDQSLFAFSQEVYQQLDSQAAHLPARFIPVFGYMRTQNWLYHYRSEQGLAQSLGGLVRRAAYLSDSQPALRSFREHRNALRACYEKFFPDVKQFAKQKLSELVLISGDISAG
jgi:acyl carrier protein phosphodiesterase